MTIKILLKKNTAWQKLKIIIGNTATGNCYYPRPQIIEDIGGIRILPASEGAIITRKIYISIVCSSLLTNHVEGNLKLRITPEVQPTVEEIVADIRENQCFYA